MLASPTGWPGSDSSFYMSSVAIRVPAVASLIDAHRRILISLYDFGMSKRLDENRFSFNIVAKSTGGRSLRVSSNDW